MKINSFSRTYGNRVVLSLPDIEIQNSAVCAVIGANGSGKSTLAKILSGNEVTDSNASPLSDVAVGYMPQKSFAFRMSVRNNLLLNGSDTSRADALMRSMGILPLAEKKAHRLSGGETARMALCRLLMRKYELLILDEPTAAMDMESTALSEKLIETYRRETGCTVILITHSLQQAKRMADEVLFLDQGRLCEFGDAKKLPFTPQTEELKKFLDFYGA